MGRFSPISRAARLLGEKTPNAVRFPSWNEVSNPERGEPIYIGLRNPGVAGPR